ncbi:iron complex outermembrane receptor protein [Sphingomonas sp. UYAg733]
MTISIRARLLATTLLLMGAATPALAQDAAQGAAVPDQAAPAAEPTPPEEAASDTGPDIIVTGSILRQTSTQTPSPVTVLSAETLDQRGINTVQEAIQQLASNNGPALTNSFTANGAFAGGASAVSLRGLSTSSTLVLFDGLRAAYFPLSDDGTRNFVDLNTIPDDIVERIEVLRDGASSSYGADAIAGVVNIITKRQFNGVGGRVEAGVSENGNAANQRLTLTAGIGDLDEKGFNAYISGFYVRSEAVYNRDLPAPFNSDDQRGICMGTVCGPNNILNGPNAAGVFPARIGATSDFFVQPFNSTDPTTALGRAQILNPARGCLYGPSHTLTAAELAANANNPLIACQEDQNNLYGQVTPSLERFGGSARFTAKVGDSAEAYILFNFQQSSSAFTNLPGTIRANAPPGIRYPRFSTSGNSPANAAGSGILTLPIYVCAARVNCTAANGRLNPNNPFAALGQVAQLSGRLGDDIENNKTRSRVYRVAAGITGRVFGDWDYKVDATAMHTDFRRTTDGYVYIQNLLDVIADGSFNFVNPQLNSQAIRDYLTPVNITDATSDMYQAQFTLGKSLFDLPGGPLQLGLGASIRYEAIDAPSANPDYNGPTQRYFRLNAFGTSGNRTVSSVFGELNAPIVDQFEVNLSGRYDKYSSGQSAFSPKIGAKFTPVKQLALRATYSRGFRIPSFAEANALPTTGFVPVSIAGLPNSFLAPYGCTNATPTDCPAYLRAASVGLTTLASPDLKPEKSRSFTGGVVFEPIRNFSIIVDYYNIKKTGAITTPANADAIAAYYLGQPIPGNFTIIPDAPLPGVNGIPRIAFVQSQLINSDTIRSEGIDVAINGSFKFGENFRLTSSLEASYIIDLSTTFPDGSTESYEGTLGNFNLTAGSGTPRWHGSWRNTLQADPFTVSATVNYFGGYNLSAEDQNGAGTSGSCDFAPNPRYVPCDVARYITIDAVGSIKVNDKFTFYVNVMNLLGDLPPLDVVTYGASLYNAVQGGNGVLGRQFRAGAKFNF